MQTEIKGNKARRKARWTRKNETLKNIHREIEATKSKSNYGNDLENDWMIANQTN